MVSNPGEEDEITLEEPIDGGTLDHWCEWDYSLREGPEAEAALQRAFNEAKDVQFSSLASLEHI